MVAMDVVDTLRHRATMVDRELNESERRSVLVEKLREIYASQGIEVTDALLEEGVKALEEDRFAYEPTPPSIQRWLAHKYIGRGKKSKPFLMFVGAALLMFTINFFTEVLPQKRLEKQLPNQIETIYASLNDVVLGDTARQKTEQLYRQAVAALNQENRSAAEDRSDEMSQLLNEVQNEYQIRVVNEPGVQSGVWRVPDVNQSARNYYLIVEAINSQGNRIDVNIFSEESNETKNLSRWGVRVSETDFNRIVADKSDDGIIQRAVIGTKQFGYLMPEYSVSSSGAAIHDW